MIDRRAFLTGAAAALAATELAAGPTHKEDMFFGAEVPFSFEALIGWARDLSKRPFEKPVIRDADIVNRIDFDEYQEIKFKPESAIWQEGDGPWPIQLFHVGKYFKEPVAIFVVSKNGMARQVKYAPDLFEYGKSAFAKALPADTGFAGFRVMTAPGVPDWLAFLGASYFRSSGETRQYGLSTRGLAIDVAMPTPEEFPRFTGFWLEAVEGKRAIAINALLDSPRITGAYRIETTHDKGTVMDIQVHLFPRAPIERVGIGPLTSMFWYGKHNSKAAIDWRPEIHDSDGLAIWTGGGERIWRPLNNPLSVQTSSFFDINPKGFGLLQRDRRFGQYEDDGTFYDLRPSVWVEPVGEWGEGAVQLVEIPTNDEIHDNIVAYWTPKKPYAGGEHHKLRYRLFWLLDEPYVPPLARVISTRVGAGGMPGRPRPKGTLKYVIDFAGGKLVDLRRRGDVDLVVSAPSGKIARAVAYPVVDTNKWRAMFDFTQEKPEPVDLRLFLRKDGQALSETWIFQHLPTLTSMWAEG